MTDEITRAAGADTSFYTGAPANDEPASLYRLEEATQIANKNGITVLEAYEVIDVRNGLRGAAALRRASEYLNSHPDVDHHRRERPGRLASRDDEPAK